MLKNKRRKRSEEDGIRVLISPQHHLVAFIEKEKAHSYIRISGLLLLHWKCRFCTCVVVSRETRQCFKHAMQKRSKNNKMYATPAQGNGTTKNPFMYSHSWIEWIVIPGVDARDPKNVYQKWKQIIQQVSWDKGDNSSHKNIYNPCVCLRS